ncbi:MAG: hypothetical protein PGN12_16580 [Sphingomonas phyllosphaerae]
MLVALANLVAVIVDTMRNAQVPNEVVHHFIDELAELNAITLNGEPTGKAPICAAPTVATSRHRIFGSRSPLPRDLPKEKHHDPQVHRHAQFQGQRQRARVRSRADAGRRRC